MMQSRNNFDLLRLLFAGVVCVVHAQQLSGMSELTFVTWALSSTVAVKAFFVVSGYLIFMSYDRSSSIWSYAPKTRATHLSSLFHSSRSVRAWVGSG